jgi:hypothetical protein
MATYSQTPGTLNVVVNRGDELGMLLDLDIATTGYSFVAEVYTVTDGTVIATPTVAAVDDATGKINVSMTEAQTEALPVGTYGILVAWTAPGAVGRRMLDGVLEVKA